MSADQSKVIVVGGGPVGLTAAIALEKAGLDFVVLERRSEIVINAGSSLVLNPEGLRSLAQLGVRPNAINAVSSPLRKTDRVDHAGNNIGDLQFFVLMKELLGAAPRVLSRQDLTKTLFSALSPASQAKVLPSKRLVDITSLEDAIVAHCDDGSSYTGSFIIGADGAHSKVRDLMQKLQKDSNSTNINETPAFLTTYRCLWLRYPRPASMFEGTTCECHGRLAATQSFAGVDTAVTGVYERMEKPTRERVRYNQADQDALVERWGHIPLTGDAKLTLRDAWDSRIESGLVSLEEGVVEQWSWDGRVVLAGDAAHKFTPSMGSGCNNGIIDIVALVNQVDRITAKTQDESRESVSPLKEELASAFKAYQDQRYEAVVEGCRASGQATATATWQTGTHKFMDRHVMSSQRLQKFFIKQAAKSATKTPSVTFGCKEDNGIIRASPLSSQIVVTA